MCKETNISLLLEDICERFRPVAENQQIEFHLVCESSDMIGYLDEDKVVKIIGNLVSNAIKFNSKGGRVTVLQHKSMINRICRRRYRMGHFPG